MDNISFFMRVIQITIATLLIFYSIDESRHLIKHLELAIGLAMFISGFLSFLIQRSDN